MRHSAPYKTAVDMQRLLERDVRNPLVSPNEKAKLVLAWCTLEERKRILKGKPLVKPVEAKKKQRIHSIYSEPAIVAS